MTTRTITTAIREVVTYKELLFNLTRRELRSRFRRSFLGWGWSFMQPVLMTAVYALVLGQFFKATPAPGDPSGIDTFVFFLLAGVVPWSLFAGGLGAGVGSVVERRRSDHARLVPSRAAADVGDPRPGLLRC